MINRNIKPWGGSYGRDIIENITLGKRGYLAHVKYQFLSTEATVPIYADGTILKAWCNTFKTMYQYKINYSNDFLKTNSKNKG